MKKNHRISFAMLSALVLLAGCGSTENNIREELDVMTKDVKGRIAPLPVIVPYEAFSYQAENLVDPFAPVKISAKFRNANGTVPDEKRAKEYLETFPLDTIKMAGSVKIRNVQYAVVVIDGMTYKVRVGSYMGQNFGRVTSITESGITLKEMTQESGDWVEKTSELLLQGTN